MVNIVKDGPIRRILPGGSVNHVARNMALATAVALGAGTVGVATHPGKNGLEARVFVTPYKQTISAFLAKNNKQGWIIMPGIQYSGSLWGKTQNMPYESVPLVQKDINGNTVDIAWPQSDDPRDNISLMETMKVNNIPLYIAQTLLEIMFSEEMLSTKGVSMIRHNFPDIIEKIISMGATMSVTPKAASQSAAKVKLNTLNDYSPEAREKILTHALGLQFQRASRQNAIRIQGNENHIPTGYNPIYQILGYKSLTEAKSAFLQGKIDTKGELGVALATAIVSHFSDQIKAKYGALGALRAPDGSVTANTSQRFYESKIRSHIKDAGDYTQLTRVVNQGELLRQQIRSIEQQLKRKLSQKKRKDLKREIERLQRDLDKIPQQSRAITSSHYTVFKHDVNTILGLIAGLNHVGALWPTNIPRALGQNSKNNFMGTYEQYMINILTLIAQWKMGVPANFIAIDGDAGPGTFDQARKFGIVDPSMREEVFNNARKEILANIVQWKPEFEKAIDTGDDAKVSGRLMNLMTVSFEHRYVAYAIIKGYLQKRQDDGSATPGILVFKKGLDEAWQSYVGIKKDEKPFNDILDILTHPSQFSLMMNLSRENTKRFYEARLISRLATTALVNMESGVIIPEIYAPGSGSTNTSHTTFRANPHGLTDVPPLIQRQGPYSRPVNYPSAMAVATSHSSEGKGGS